MNSKLILWDFDGTLADTLQLVLDTYNQIADSCGFKQVDDLKSVRDFGMRDFLKSHGIPAWRVPQLFAQSLTLTNKLIGTVPFFAGITDMLADLQSRGFRHGIVSSNSTTNIQSCLEFNHATTLFDHVCGTSRLTGKERRIRKAMKQFQVDSADCLYIGDEIRDVEAAAAAGLPIGCVSWGLNSVDVLQVHFPIWIAGSPAELPDLIQQHFEQDA